MTRQGNYATGRRNGSAKLYPVDIRIIRWSLSQGMPVRRLAKTFGVAPKTISKIRDGVTWRDV